MTLNHRDPASSFRQVQSVNEFCKTWGIGRTLFYKLTRAGEIRVIRLGRRTLVPTQQGEEWLRASAS